MKTLSVKLTDGLDARLTAAARRHKTTKSTLVRKTLEDDTGPLVALLNRRDR